MYGNPETTTGGRALKFYATVRLDIRRTDAIKLGTNIIGNSVRVKVVKNKVAPPFKSCNLDIIYGQGISKEGETVDLGVQFGFVQKTGNWYDINGEKIGNGREAAKAYFKENPEVAEQINAKIREAFKGEEAPSTDENGELSE